MKRLRLGLLLLAVAGVVAAVAACIISIDERLSRYEDARWRLKNRGFVQDYERRTK